MLVRYFRYAVKHGVSHTIHRVRIKSAHALARLTYQKFVKSDYAGVLMAANWDDITFKLCLNGGYGHFYSDYLLNFEEEFLFLDIGANQGVYTLVATKNPNCVEAFAFEPVASTFLILAKNTAENGRLNVRLIEAAISSYNGTGAINIKSGHSGAASISHKLDALAEGTQRNIKLINYEELEQIVPQGKISIVIKIDVEGHEKVVIEELLKCSFFDRIFSIFYEVDKAWCNPIDLKNTLEQNGFSVFTRVGTDDYHYDILASKL